MNSGSLDSSQKNPRYKRPMLWLESVSGYFYPFEIIERKIDTLEIIGEWETAVRTG